MMTGVTAHPTPISAELYAKLGYPFFEVYEEPSNVHGSIEGLKSVGQVDRSKGKNLKLQKNEKMVDFLLRRVQGKRAFKAVRKTKGPA